MFDKVKEIVVEQLGVEEDAVTMSASFVDDLGADSLDIVELIMAFEEAFDIEIPDEKLLLTEMNTISKMTEVISAVLDNQNNSIGE